MLTGRQLREELVLAIRQRLIGPSEPNERIRERPDKRYLCGMLFPRDAKAVVAIKDEPEDREGEDIDDNDADTGIESPTDLLFQRLPSSVGLTFAVDPKESLIRVRVAAGIYLHEDQKKEEGGARRGTWVRTPLPSDQKPEELLVQLHEGVHEPRPVLEGRADLYIRNRLANGMRVVTVALINRARADEETERIDPADVLYQVELLCEPSCGVPSYPDPPDVGSDLERKELALRYRERPTFAVGHGCAVFWPKTENGRVSWVKIDFVPGVEIAPVTTDIPELPNEAQSILKIQDLQRNDFDPSRGFSALVQAYADWRKCLDPVDIPARFAEPKLRTLARIDRAIERMRRGAELLRQRDVLDIFRKANRAMLLNLARQAAAKNNAIDAPHVDPDLDREDLSKFVWRPFQIAFFLLVVEGIWDTSSPDRAEADLLWFPTGGGKTEAYLLVAAFEMIRRRVLDGQRGEGTSVIKRYTLRLLTIQQFERAAGLICALETLRHRHELPGESPFSLGLWVGEASSPNTNSDALKDLNTIADTVGQIQGVKLPLKHCPTCGTAIVPESKEQGLDGVGIRKEHGQTKLFCVKTGCDFQNGLPIHFVDEVLYKDPPTMLLGTIDKFAMLAWRDPARAFFGVGKNFNPPSLIIQDELHLISGPLGTVAGVYEAAIDCAIRQVGSMPKIICATATIRRSEDQMRRLYGRPGSVFPPPGLDASDSFFSRAASIEAERPGRLYVGAMGQGHTPTYSNVLAAAALLDAVAVIREKYGDVVDTWWTLVSYHNSKRELGRMLTLARDDVPTRLATLGSGRKIAADNVEELSANLKDSQIPEMIQRLKIGLPNPATLDFVACTNMLSVGVDIERLGLMLVSGQPKANSEYIQASSRVGRSQKMPPGLVLCLLSPTRPRDRSHYEFFRPFHEGFYRYVEPTSVTPYALPARERALHGAFISLVRMVSPLYKNEHAAKLNDAKDRILELRDRLLARIREAEPDEVDDSKRRIDSFLDEWQKAVTEQGVKVRFSTNTQQYRPLLKRYWQEGQGWETLQSLRHVSPPLSLKPDVATRQGGT